jgi:methyl-accepting chemotaxis protein
VTTSTDQRLGLRGGLRRLSTGLLVYGAVGLLVAIIGLAGVVYVTGRINTAEERAAVTIAELNATLERTATALSDASATAGSFTSTIDTSATTIGQAAVTIRDITPQLHDLENQFRSINILGAQPLSRAADLMGQLATGIEGLDQRLDGVAGALTDNQDRLATNGESLGALAVQLGVMTDRLESGVVEDSLADVQVVVTVLMLLFVMWTAVPAIGALFLGVWVRRELGRADDGASAKVVA